MPERVSTITLKNFGGKDTRNTSWGVDPRDCVESQNVYVEAGNIRKRPALKRKFLVQLPANVDATNEASNFSQQSFIWQTSTTGVMGDQYSETWESGPTNADINAYDTWSRLTGDGTNQVIKNQNTLAPNGSWAAQPRFISTGSSASTKYRRMLANALSDYTLYWKFEFSNGLSATWGQDFVGLSGGDDTVNNYKWKVRVQYSNSSTAIVEVADVNSTYTQVYTMNSATVYRFQMRVTSGGAWTLYINEAVVYTGNVATSIVPILSVSTSDKGNLNCIAQFTKSYSVTNPVASNQIMIVKVIYDQRPLTTSGLLVNGVTFNGVAMTKLATVNGAGVGTAYNNLEYGIVYNVGTNTSYWEACSMALPQPAAFRSVGTNGGTWMQGGVYKSLNTGGGGTVPTQLMDIYYIVAPYQGTANVAVTFRNPGGATGTFPYYSIAEVYQGVNQNTPFAVIPSNPNYSGTNSQYVQVQSTYDGTGIYPVATGVSGPNGTYLSVSTAVCNESCLASPPAVSSFAGILPVTNKSESQAGGGGQTIRTSTAYETGLATWAYPSYSAFQWSLPGDGHVLWFATLSLIPSAGSSVTPGYTDRIVLAADQSSGVTENLGAWDDILIRASFVDSSTTQIFVVMGGYGNTTPVLVRGDALNPNTPWTTVGAIGADTNVNIMPYLYQDKYILPEAPPLSSPQVLSTSFALSALGGSPPAMPHVGAYNRMLFGGIVNGKLQFSGIDNVTSWTSSDTLTLGHYLWTPSAVWPMTGFLLVITESGLYAVTGYGRDTNSSTPLSVVYGSGDFGAVTGSDMEAYFIGHSSQRRVINVPGQNPYQGIYKVSRWGIITCVSDKMINSDMFLSTNKWSGNRVDVAMSFDSYLERLYVLAPRYHPVDTQSTATTGKTLFVMTNNGGWNEWSFSDKQHLSYVYPFGINFSASVTSGRAVCTLVGGGGADGWRYIYSLDEGYNGSIGVSGMDADANGNQTVAYTSQWVTPLIPIYQDPHADIVRWLMLYGNQTSGGGVTVEYRFDEKSAWIVAGDSKTGNKTWDLTKHKQRIPIGQKCSAIQFRWTFASDAVEPEIEAAVIGFNPIGFLEADTVQT